MKPFTRILAAAGILAAAAFSLCPPARGLEPPTKEQLARYRLDGTLASRVARAKAFGNHKIPQRIQDRMERKLGRLAVARSGIDPGGGRRAPGPAPGLGGDADVGHGQGPGPAHLLQRLSRDDDAGLFRLPALRGRGRRSALRQPPRLLPAFVLRPADDRGQRPRLVPGAVRPEHRRRDGRGPAEPDQGSPELLRNPGARLLAVRQRR